MKKQIVQALCLLVATALVSCKTVETTNSESTRKFSSWKKANRKPKVSRPTTRSFSGRVNQRLLNEAHASNTKVIIDIADQRGYLLVNGEVAIETPVSTARTGKYTPTGTFTITERVQYGKVSTIYDVSMPYWMRLNDTPFGLHSGFVPGYPASAGCVRLPDDMARLFYQKTGYGTQVRILSYWNG